MTRTYIIAALFLVALSAPAAADNRMWWGPQKSQWSPIVSRSGIGTEHARIRVRLTEDQRGITPALPTEYTANCRTGVFRDNGGEETDRTSYMLYNGPNAIALYQKAMDGQMVRRQISGATMGGMDTIFRDHFRALCPKGLRK